MISQHLGEEVNTMYANPYDNSYLFHDLDWNLRQAVRVAIDQDDRIPAQDRQAVEVTVAHGIVMLTGRVKCLTSKMLAYGDALQVNGIHEVLDTILVAKKV